MFGLGVLVDEHEFDDNIREKARRGTNSGYLPQEYEVSKEFPIVHDYHFRIEDQRQIIELQQLHDHSQPFAMQQSFNQSSDGFKGRLEMLINQLDQHQVAFPNSLSRQQLGVYHLPDHYNDDSQIQRVLQKESVEELRDKVEKMSVQDFKPQFMRRGSKKVEGEGGEVKKLSKKMNRMTITEEDL